MANKKRRIIKKITIVMSLALLASAMSAISIDSVLVTTVLDVCAFCVYVSLLVAWGVQIQRRIMHRKIRRALLVTDGMLLSWMFIWTIRYWVFADMPDWSRYAWYCYYIPIYVIVFIVYMVSRYIGEDENYKIPLKKWWPAWPTVFGLVMVFTNDFHNLFFIIKSESPLEYSYGILYFISLSWIIYALIRSLMRIQHCYSEKTRIIKRLLPFIVLSAGVTYLLLYSMNVVSKRIMFVDYVVAVSLLVVGVWEVLIETGMIPSNYEYEWCFENSTLGMQIVNSRGESVISSQNAIPITQEKFKKLMDKFPVQANENKIYEVSEIHDWYVVWEKDIKDEREVLDELNDAVQNLNKAMEVLRSNIEAEGKKHRLSEKNRLYDLVISNIDMQLKEIEERLVAARGATKEEFERLIREINIIGVYVKRKSNLVLIDQMHGTEFGEELKLCFRETFDNVKKAGINAEYMFMTMPRISIDIALIMYDLLENVIETTFYGMKTILAIVSGTEEYTSLTVNVQLNEGITVSKTQIQESFSKWREVICDNYPATFDIEAENAEITISLKLNREENL